MWTCTKLAIALTVLWGGEAFAQGSAYPNKPLRWLVPFAPAGGPISSRARSRSV